VLVLTDDSLLLVGVNGSVLSTIAMPSKKCDYSKRAKSMYPVDAVYLEGLRSVLVALSDDSLVHVPLMAATNTDRSTQSIATNIDMDLLEKCTWSAPILSLSAIGKAADGRTSCLVRTSDAVAAVMLADASSIPSSPEESPKKIGNVLGASSHNSGHVSALVSGSKKGSTQLLSWQRPSAGWLSTDSASTSVCALGNAASGHEVVGVYASKNCTFVTLRAASASGASFRLLKCGAAQVLFQRDLPEGVQGAEAFTAILESPVQMELYFLDNKRNLRSWCGRYGCPRTQWTTTESQEAKTEPVKTPVNTKRGRGAGGADILQSLTTTKDQSTSSNNLYAVGGIPGSPTLYRVQKSSGGSSLVRIVLGGGASKPLGLLGALGSMLRSNSKAIPQMTRIFDSQQPGSILNSSKDAAAQEGGAKGKGVLAALPRPLKRKLQQLTQWRAKFAEEQDKDNEDGGGEPQSPLKRARIAAAQAPFDACASFLKELQACESPKDILASDWDVVLTLLTTQRCVSLQFPHNTTLIDLCLAAGRLDVLCCAARYAPDLSETQAVQTLIRLARWNPSSTTGVHAMKYLQLNRTGALEWHSKGIQTAASTPAASNTPSKGKGKGKAKQEEVLGGESSATQSLTHLDVLRVLSESLLRRSGGFSVQLLADAIREHACPSEAGLLLHLFLLFLRGLCGGANAQFFGFVHDQQVARAVDWSEALLDAHFCGIALSTSSASGSGSKGPLEGALQVAAGLLSTTGISAGEEGIEQALGAWTHIWRSAKRLKEATDAGQTRATLRPPSGMYRLEKLVF